MEGVLGEIRSLVGRLAEMLRGMRLSPPAPTAAPPREPPAQAAAAAAAPRRSAPRPAETGRPPPALADQQRGMDMAEALATAVERLRARASSAPPLPEDPGEPPPPAAERPAPFPRAPLPADPAAPEPAPAPPRDEIPLPTPEPAGLAHSAADAEGVAARPGAKPPARPRHKHSQSLLGRIFNRRKQRRSG
jgi:hypothetical protein